MQLTLVASLQLYQKRPVPSNASVLLFQVAIFVAVGMDGSFVVPKLISPLNKMPPDFAAAKVRLLP